MQGSEKTSEKVGRTDGRILECKRNRSYLWKSSRKMGLYTQYDRIGALLTGASAITSVYGILKPLGMNVTISLMVAFATFFTWFDSFCVIRLFIASGIRKLISFNLVLIGLCVWIHSENYYSLVLICTATIILVSMATNKRLLYSEGYKYSDVVQHGLIADLENESGEAWQTWGKVSCRTVYGNAGLQIDDEVLDMYAKPVFFMAYFKSKGNLSRLKNELAFKESVIAEYEETFDKMNQSIEGMQDDLRVYQMAEHREKVETESREKLMLSNEKLIKENELLRAANEELMHSESRVEFVHDCDDMRYLLMTNDERQQELFERRYKDEKSISYMQIATALDLAKSTIEGRYKSFKKNKEAKQ